MFKRLALLPLSLTGWLALCVLGQGRSPTTGGMEGFLRMLDVWDGNPEDFDTRNPDHVDMISYGKVVLFFSIRFVSEDTGYDKVHKLCLVEELLELKQLRDANTGSKICIVCD